MKKDNITFVPSAINSCHYIHIGGKSTRHLINLHAYKNPKCADYKKKIDSLIETLNVH